MSRKHVDEIAMFGGNPLFKKARPVGQLAMPDIDAYLALVRGAFDARQLSGGGLLVRTLERELESFHEVDHCIAIANAGLGLTMLMQHFAADVAGEVIMPAFSFRGLPHFAQWAGQLPRFCDVDALTHGLTVNSVASSICASTTSILAVNNFHAACDIDGLAGLAEDAGVPLFFDSVYGVGSTYKGRMLGGFGRAEVFSTHATKLLNGFEGGYITTNDAGLAAALRAQRESERYNLRLNELHAGMALLCLRELDAVIERNEARYRAYERICSGIAGLDLLAYLGEGSEKLSYEMAVVDVGEPWPLTRDETLRMLAAEGAAITGYYHAPLHKSVHCPARCLVPDLPVAEALAKRFAQLPVGELLSLSDIDAVGELFALVSQNAPQIRGRLDAGVAA